MADKPPGFARYKLKAPRGEIFYISWTVDAYDGVAFVKNEDEDGVLSIFCPAEFAGETEKIIAAFESEGIAIERLSKDLEYGGAC
jgi:hypothetical protein